MNVKRIKIFFCVFFLGILISCSMPRILYNTVDLFIVNWFDVHFELNVRQRSNLKKAIENLLDWHRKSELPKIVLFLEGLKYKYEKGLKEEDIKWTRYQLKEFWLRTLNHIENDLVFLLLTIEESQVVNMQSRLLERDDWLTEQSKMNSNELHENILDWLYETLEDWLGNLEASQKTKIANWVKPDPTWVAIKLKNREKFQNDIVHLLQSKESLKENFNIWMYQPELHWTDEFKAHVENKKQEWVDIILKIDAITLPRQRKNATNELQNYIGDFQHLIKK